MTLGTHDSSVGGEVSALLIYECSKNFHNEVVGRCFNVNLSVLSVLWVSE